MFSFCECSTDSFGVINRFLAVDWFIEKVEFHRYKICELARLVGVGAVFRKHYRIVTALSITFSIRPLVYLGLFSLFGLVTLKDVRWEGQSIKFSDSVVSGGGG